MSEKDIVNVKKPELIIFAGPNGSGKSTITDVLRPFFATYINQDEIKKFLHCSDMEALDNIHRVLPLCDGCHIYDNSYTTEGGNPHRIFKKRKEKCFYHENNDWLLEDIQDLTGITDIQQKNLNMY